MQLLRKSDSAGDLNIRPSLRHDDGEAFERIRCPLCDWRPGASSSWCCWWDMDTPEPRFDSCGTHFNTFLTHGRCPGCQHRWQWTSCLSCHGWSLHDDWYECG